MIRLQKIGFMGFGNMSQALVRTFIDKGGVDPKRIFVTNRSEKKLIKAEKEFGVQVLQNNEELLEKCDIVFLAMKPQDMLEAIEPLNSDFLASHLVVSLAAGISIDQLQGVLPNCNKIARVMPNTPAQISEAVIGLAMNNGAKMHSTTLIELFSYVGSVFEIEEGESFEALTVACGSGIGFIFEIMIYWQEWLEEHGFEKEDAKKLTLQTFKGASLLADHLPISVEEMQSKVVSKKGVTAAGLDSMRELEIERALRYSFEKAVLRDRELGRNS